MKIYLNKLNNDIGRAYKVLSKKLKNEKVFEDLKKYSFFQSKGKKKREKLKQAIIRNKRNHKKNLERLILLDNNISKINRSRQVTNFAKSSNTINKFKTRISTNNKSK